MRWYHSVALSPDGETLAYDETGDSIIVWDVATGTTATLPTGGRSIQFSPDGETLAIVSRLGTIHLWKLPATQVRITPFPAESPSIGAELTINVAIVAGQNVGGYQVTVEFDETALRYAESANGDYLPPGAFAAPPDVRTRRC